ncbi:MAG: arginine repressor [Ruminococcaceae bacterium]|nr:arginine repressor [Oscillospiraceae bacterium]
MKTQRQAKILEIIETMDIETQEQLLEQLSKCGFKSTQATISRDIKELRMVKELTSMGTYRYTTTSKDAASTFITRLNTIFRECVTTYDQAQNLVVLKTLPGLASAACSAIDSMNIPHIVGTLAGDDTCLLVMSDNASAANFCLELKKMVS